MGLLNAALNLRETRVFWGIGKMIEKRERRVGFCKGFELSERGLENLETKPLSGMYVCIDSYRNISGSPIIRGMH